MFFFFFKEIEKPAGLDGWLTKILLPDGMWGSQHGSH